MIRQKQIPKLPRRPKQQLLQLSRRTVVAFAIIALPAFDIWQRGDYAQCRRHYSLLISQPKSKPLRSFRWKIPRESRDRPLRHLPRTTRAGHTLLDLSRSSCTSLHNSLRRLPCLAELVSATSTQSSSRNPQCQSLLRWVNPSRSRIGTQGQPIKPRV